MVRPKIFLLLALLAGTLAACGGGEKSQQKNIDTLDEQLTEGASANGADPVVSSALQDPIMVDPALAGKSNTDSIRPPAQPYSAPIPAVDAPPSDNADGTLKSAPAPVAGRPCRECAAARDTLTLGALAGRQADRRTQSCAASISYAAGWANRLPRDLPLHPAARVIEAAGSNAKGCALRIVSFAATLPMQRLLDWYYTRATDAGYSAEHQAERGQHVLGGTRGRDNAAYVLFLTNRADGGTDVDLIANNGV